MIMKTHAWGGHHEGITGHFRGGIRGHHRASQGITPWRALFFLGFLTSGHRKNPVEQKFDEFLFLEF